MDDGEPGIALDGALGLARKPDRLDRHRGVRDVAPEFRGLLRCADRSRLIERHAQVPLPLPERRRARPDHERGRRHRRVAPLRVLLQLRDGDVHRLPRRRRASYWHAEPLARRQRYAPRVHQRERTKHNAHQRQGREREYVPARAHGRRGRGARRRYRRRSIRRRPPVALRRGGFHRHRHGFGQVESRRLRHGGVREVINRGGGRWLLLCRSSRARRSLERRAA